MDKSIKEAFDFKGKKIPTYAGYIAAPEYQCVITHKMKRLYEDDDFIIDVFKDEEGLPILRISVFEDGHYLDGLKLYKKDYLD